MGLADPLRLLANAMTEGSFLPILLKTPSRETLLEVMLMLCIEFWRVIGADQ
jgi:hypothetical protein